MHIVQLYLLLFFCNAYIHAAHMVAAQIQCHVGKSDLLEIGIDFFTLGIFYQKCDLLWQNLDSCHGLLPLSVDTHAHLMKAHIKK